MTTARASRQQAPLKRSAVVALLSAATVVASPAFATEAAAPDLPTTCTLEPGPIRTVTRILDGETVTLDDGTEVRLIGALAPRAFDADATPGAWPAEAIAIRTLTDLVLGRPVKLAYGGRRTDRYGRQLAHLFVGSGSTEIWVQGAMLSAGAARTYGLPGSYTCASELLANEHVASARGLGVWATTTYALKPAKLTALLLSRRSHFEIVTGAVTAVSRTKSAVYLNFGADLKTDFTVRIAKGVLDANLALDQKLAGLKNQVVTVRGWIERRNGPMIDVKDPSQLVFDSDALAPADATVSERVLPKATEGVSAPDDDTQPSAEPDSTPKRNRPALDLPKAPGDANL